MISTLLLDLSPVLICADYIADFRIISNIDPFHMYRIDPSSAKANFVTWGGEEWEGDGMLRGGIERDLKLMHELKVHIPRRRGY